MSLGCLAGADKGAAGLATARPHSGREIQELRARLRTLLVVLRLSHHPIRQPNFELKGSFTKTRLAPTERGMDPPGTRS